MAAIALPDLDRHKLQEIRERLTPLSSLDLAEVGLPRLEDVGRRAEAAVDRWTGRSRPSRWRRLLPALGLLAIVGVVVALVTWNRRTSWNDASSDIEADGFEPMTGAFDPELTGTTPAEPGTVAPGLTAAEASLMSTDPSEDVLP